MTEQVKHAPQMQWTGVMLEIDGLGIAYPVGNANDSLMKEIVAAWNSRQDAEPLAKALKNSVKANELLRRELAARGFQTPTLDGVIEQARAALKLWREGKS